MILFWLDTYRAVQMSSSWDGLGTKWYSSGLVHIEQFRCQVHERALTLNDTLLAYCNSSDVKFMTWPLHQIILFWHITTVQMSSSEWVSDCFLRQLSNFSAISWREQVNFQWDDDEICFVLDQRAELDFYSASSLKQQSAGRHVAPFGHIIQIPSQPEATNTNFIVFGLTRPGLEPTIDHTRGEHANHYTMYVVDVKFMKSLNHNII